MARTKQLERPTANGAAGKLPVPLFSDAQPPPKPPTKWPSQEMHTETVLVTPGMAADFLSRPPARRSNGEEVRQRNLDENWVNDIRGWIRDGDWMCSPEGFAFARDGGMLEGMHRSHAIVREGVPVPVRITYNVDADVFPILNTGKKRTGANMLQISGTANAFATASALKLLHCYTTWLQDPLGDAMPWTDWARIRPSHMTIDRLRRAHPNLVDLVTPGSTMMTRVHGIPAAGIVFLYLARAAWPTTPGLKKLDAFVTDVREGEMLEKGNPAYTLREWLGRDGGNRVGPRAGRAKRERQLYALLQAWDSYAAGEPRKSIVLREDEPMCLAYEVSKAHRRRQKEWRRLLDDRA